MITRTVERKAATCLVFVAALSILWVGPEAQASHQAFIGIGDCSGPASVEPKTGEEVVVVACLEGGRRALTGYRVYFLEAGPDVHRFHPRVTGSDGSATLELGGRATGFRRVGLCDASTCFGGIEADWGGRHAEQATRGDFSVTGTAAPLGPPARGGPPLAPPGRARRCSPSPGAVVQAPAFVSIESATRTRGVNPRTRRLAEVVIIRTKQSLITGSAAHRVPALAFALGADPGIVDPGPPPLQGFNHLLIFATDGRLGFHKREMVYSGTEWTDLPPKFTVVAEHERVAFYSVDASFSPLLRLQGGARAGEFCGSSDLPEPPPRRGSALALGMLGLVGALAAGVIRATQPPRGTVIDEPHGLQIRFERSDITYDSLGRPTGYVDHVEVPGGTVVKVLTRIDQEALVTEPGEFLDAWDWEDPQFAVERRDLRYAPDGRLLSYVEDVRASDGTTNRHRVTNIRWSHDRVHSYARAVSVLLSGMNESRPRLEQVTIEYDSPGWDALMLGLSRSERIERSELRFNDEGHIVGYMARCAACSLADDSAGVTPEVPRALFELGAPVSIGPVFRSEPLHGPARVRSILTSWFRRHGCRVTLAVVSSSGPAMGALGIRFGSRVLRLSKKGEADLWVLHAGDYAVSIESPSPVERLHAHPGSSQPAEGVIGWVVVRYIPGRAVAAFRLGSRP